VSFYSWFYEVTILESTCTIGEGKKYKCISKCYVVFVVETKYLLLMHDL